VSHDIESIISHIEEGKERRNAYGSFYGYLYQFELTLSHILLEGTEADLFDGSTNSQHYSASFQIETIEDYTKMYNLAGKNYLRVAQIKHHTTNCHSSKYREAILYLYYSYLRFRQLRDDADYQAAVFYCSPNEINDSALTILLAAFNENDRKAEHDVTTKRKAEVEGTSVPKETTLKIYRDILELGLDSEENRRSFSEVSRLIKVDNRDQTITGIKANIEFLVPHATLSSDVLLSVATYKIMQDGGARVKITKNEMITYLSSATTLTEKAAYIKLIHQNLYFLIKERLLKSILWQAGETDIYEKYCQIADCIYVFIISKFEDERNYRSFLRTVVPISANFEFHDNYFRCYEEFLKSNEFIFSFVFRLSKIAFMYWTTLGEKPNFDEWFEVNESKWLFKYPHEERADGIIVGKLSSDIEFDVALAEISYRYSDDENKPQVWYFMSSNNERCYGYDDLIAYQFDFCKIPQEFSALDVKNTYFFIECMDCICEKRCDQIEDVGNIFLKECCREA